MIMQMSKYAILVGAVAFCLLSVVGCEEDLPKPLDGDAAGFNKRGVSYWERGDWGEGNCRLLRSYPSRPEIRSAYFNRGMAYCGVRYSDRGVGLYWKGLSYDKAIADYTEAIRIDPKFAPAYDFRARPTPSRATMTRRLPTIPRRSGSTRNSFRPIMTVARPT